MQNENNQKHKRTTDFCKYNGKHNGSYPSGYPIISIKTGNN